MRNNGAGASNPVIPFSPNLSDRPNGGDELDRAGHAALDAVRQAAGAAEAKYKQTVEANRNLSAELRSAEERIKELEAMVRHQHGRAERAEKWLYQISVEIEQKFFEGAPVPQLRRPG